MAEKGELHFNLIALKYAGFIIEGSGMSLPAQIIFNMCLLVPYFIIHLLTAIKFFTEPFTLLRALITAFITNNGFQTLFKHFYFTYKKKSITDLLHMLEHNPATEGADNLKFLDVGMRLQSRKHTRRFSSIIFLYNMSSLMVGIIIPLCYRIMQLVNCDYEDSKLDERCKNVHPLYAYEFWWPTDIKALPTYYYLIWWEILMIGVFLATNAASDAFSCSLMLAAAERCSMLARSASQALEPASDGGITPNFRAWGKYHQHYLKLVETINEVMGPLLLMIHSFAVINIITYLYFILKFNDPTLVNIAVAVMTGYVIQIFFYANAGQQILNKSKDLSASTLVAAAHVTDSGLGNGPARSCLQIISARCSGSMPEEIKGMGYFTVSMDLFGKVVTASVTYLLVILQLCNCTGRINYDILAESSH